MVSSLYQGVGGLSELGIAGQGVGDSPDMLSTMRTRRRYYNLSPGPGEPRPSQPRRMFDFVVLDRGVLLIEWQGVAGIGGW